MRLFYSTNISDTSFVIDGEDHRHILKVLRYKTGDTLNIIDGSGSIYECRIHAIDKVKLSAVIMSKTVTAPMPYTLGIGISPLKNVSRLEWFIEKSVEIGISDIYPFISTRSEKPTLKVDRIHRIIQAAMKQSGNVYEPRIHPIMQFEDFLNLEEWDQKYLAYINKKQSRLLSKEQITNHRVLIGIGPEGGFTDNEAQLSRDHGFLSVSLGNSRLRTETAGVASCQIIKTLYELNNSHTIQAT